MDDAIIDGDIVDVINTGNPMSADSDYNPLNANDVPQLSVTNLDDDQQIFVLLIALCLKVIREQQILFSR